MTHRHRLDDIDLVYFEWNRDQRGAAPTLLLAHATGFHARCWDRMIHHLGDRHVLAVDLRGHGRSGGGAVTSWEVFGEDLARLVEEQGLRDLLGVGHSMGGHALVDAAARVQSAFLGLVLLDPVIFAPGSAGQDRDRDGDGNGDRNAGSPEDATHPTARRQSRFDSPEAMFERFESRRPYSLFEREALHDYCEYGLLPAPDGEGYVLACEPTTEASIYMASRTTGEILENVRAVEVPVLVVRAMEMPAERDGMDFSFSPTWPELARHFPNGRDIQLPELTHFLPMQAPAQMARLTLEHEARCLRERKRADPNG